MDSQLPQSLFPDSHNSRVRVGYEELPLKITRREFCEGSAAAALAAGWFGLSPFTGLAGEAMAQTVSSAELLAPSPLGDMSMGADNAPVTIIEYASMTCGHCAHFAVTTLPELKKRYIDTGKARYILREFPLDPLAAAGFMLARCASKDDKAKYFALVDTLFHQQDIWVVQKPLAPLMTIAKQAGLSEQAFDQCLANQSMLDGIEEVRRRAAEKLGVSSTPTFFINGQKHSGDISIDELAKLMEPYLKAG
jgi:protein-disulfide isomerase